MIDRLEYSAGLYFMPGWSLPDRGGVFFAGCDSRVGCGSDAGEYRRYRPVLILLPSNRPSSGSCSVIRVRASLIALVIRRRSWLSFFMRPPHWTDPGGRL